MGLVELFFRQLYFFMYLEARSELARLAIQVTIW
jgi:hypothetical protein